LPAPPRAPPVKAKASERCKTSETVTHEVPRTFGIRGAQSCASSGRIARTTSAPVRLCFLTVRVSRGVSALGPVKSLGLGPAPSSRLAANPGNEIRDTSELFLLPYTPSTSTRTRLFPVHLPRLFVGRVLERDAAHPNRRPARFTTRDCRFGGPSSHCGGLLGRPTHATTYL